MPYGFSVWGEDRRLILFNQRDLDKYRCAMHRRSDPGSSGVRRFHDNSRGLC